ncbi:unnamed protein product [Clavelina lepadiformis]|uniref:Uncharacterized protein n=1 Tax=Clavelina lepadiformis TaxID=159417 RepID=A0ABP0FWD2_CLALP
MGLLFESSINRIFLYGRQEVTYMTYVESPPESVKNDALITRDNNADDDLEASKRNIQRKDHYVFNNTVVVTGREPAAIFNYIHVGLFAICGCAMRILTDHLFGTLAKIQTVNGVITKSFIPNIFGCFMAGTLQGSPMGGTSLASLYTGLVLGFCGSYTTWSTWSQQLSLLVIGETKSGAQSQLLFLICLIVGMYVFFGSYRVGQDFGRTIGRKVGVRVMRRGKAVSDVTSTIVLAVCLPCFILLIVLNISARAKTILLALIFAPVGACLRLWLSHFKVIRYHFPLGTFICNICGAVLLSLLHVIVIRVPGIHCIDSSVICWPAAAIYSVDIGFCGCLTTVSALVSETYDIIQNHKLYAYSYAAVSVIATQICIGLVNGINYGIS